MSLKNLIKKIALLDFFYLFSFFSLPFNATVRKQERDYKSIPILIVNFNQLFYLRQLLQFLLDKGYKNLVILDNNSDYPPLLDFYDTIQHQVTVHRLTENFGHKVFWLHRPIYELYRKGYFVITDADVVPAADCPDDFLLHFKSLLHRHPFVKKVGFSLDLDVVPDTNPNKANILSWESQFWNRKTASGHYISEIDTTFALYRPENFITKHTHFFKAIRTKKPYTALHGGWIIDPEHLTEEQLNYFKKANYSNTWKITDDHFLQNSMYTRTNSNSTPT